MKCKNFFPSFNQGRWLIKGRWLVKGQDDVCGFSSMNLWKKQHGCWCCKQASALLEENPVLPFTGPKQSLCCSGLVCEGTDRQVLIVCGSFPPVLCNLPVNHIRGPQTAQQALTGEVMMFSPLRSHSSLSKLLTIYLDVIIVCDIIKAEKLHLCCPAYLFGTVSYIQSQCFLDNRTNLS